MTDGVRMEEISPSKSVLPRPTLTATPPPLSPLSSSPATPSPEPAQIISTSSTSSPLFTTSASPYPSLPILPWAAVFAIVIALFLTLVAGLLILRKLLKVNINAISSLKNSHHVIIIIRAKEYIGQDGCQSVQAVLERKGFGVVRRDVCS